MHAIQDKEEEGVAGDAVDEDEEGWAVDKHEEEGDDPLFDISTVVEDAFQALLHRTTPIIECAAKSLAAQMQKSFKQNIALGQHEEHAKTFLQRLRLVQRDGETVTLHRVSRNGHACSTQHVAAHYLLRSSTFLGDRKKVGAPALLRSSTSPANACAPTLLRSSSSSAKVGASALLRSSSSPAKAGASALLRSSSSPAKVGASALLRSSSSSAKFGAPALLRSSSLLGPAKVAPPCSEGMLSKSITRADAVEVFVNVLLSILRKLKDQLAPNAILHKVVLGKGAKMLLDTGLDTRVSTVGSRTKKLRQKLMDLMRVRQTQSRSSGNAQRRGAAILKQAMEEGNFERAVSDNVVKTLVSPKSEFKAHGNHWLTRGFHAVQLAMHHDPKRLAWLESELVYLRDRLLRVEDAEVTDAAWQDYTETWLSLLRLRDSLTTELGQRVLTSFTSDPKVMHGLSMAQTFSNVVAGQQCIPGDVLQTLKVGPVHHVKKYAYSYRRKVNAELIFIHRVKDIQARIVVAFGTTIASIWFALFTWLIPKVLGEDSSEFGLTL